MARSEKPRVVSLRYGIKATEPVTATNVSVPDMNFQLGRFDCRVENNTLSAAPEDHFDSIQTARNAVDPLLYAWQAWSQSTAGVWLELVYKGAEVQGTLPVYPKGNPEAALEAGRAHPKEAAVLPPPEGLGGVAWDMTQAVRRWHEVLDGSMTVSAGGYGVLTVLEDMFRGRRNMAKRLRISPRLLSQLGRLLSVGNAASGRKVNPSPADRRALSVHEERWVEGLMSHVLARAVAVDVGATINADLTANDYSLDVDAVHIQIDQTMTMRLVIREVPAP
jgi:hypothetical protein